MSELTRRMMYDKLVQLKRFDDIDEGLIKEFGTPKTTQTIKKKVSK